MPRLLIASADAALRHNVMSDPALVSVGMAEVEDARSALQEVAQAHYDLVVIDDQLPDLTVRQLLPELRASRCGVLAVCVDWSRMAATRLIEAGADDVVRSPYAIPELQARIRAILRRRASPPANCPPELVSGSLRLHVASRRVVMRDEPVQVPPLEFAVLRAVLARDGVPVPRGVLLDECWPVAASRRPEYVDGVIRRLRSRLEVDPARPENLVTIRGKGYAWRP